MQKLVGFIGMTAGGWIGWIVGDLVSFFAAFVLGMIGTGVGLYAARKFSARLLP